MGGLLGGPKGMLAPSPSQIIGGAWPPLAPLFLRLCNMLHEFCHQDKSCLRRQSSAISNIMLLRGHCKTRIIFESYDSILQYTRQFYYSQPSFKQETAWIIVHYMLGIHPRPDQPAHPMSRMLVFLYKLRTIQSIRNKQ